MILVMMVLILGIIGLTVFSTKNKFSIAIAIYMVAVSLLLFSVLLYTKRVANYHVYFKFEALVFKWIDGLKLRLSDITRLYNMGIALIMVASCIIVFICCRMKWFLKLIFIIPIVVLAMVMDPVSDYEIYIYVNTITDAVKSKRVEYLIEIFNKVYQGMIYIYLLLPIIYLIGYYRYTECFFRKKQTIVSILSILFIDLFFIYFFMFGMFRGFFLMSYNLNYFPHHSYKLDNLIMMLPLALFCVVAILYLLLYYKPFGRIAVVSDKIRIECDNILNKNVRMIYHNNKSLFFTVEALAKQAKEKYETNNSLVLGNLDKIIELAHDAVQNTSTNLDMMKEICDKGLKVNFSECVKKARQNTELGISGINVNSELDESLYVKVNSYHLTMAVTNILNNSREAFFGRDDAGKRINIRLFSEDIYAVLEIEDNGCGIQRKYIKRIYDPLFSTKQSGKNGGVGLSYVKNVCKAYGGDVHIKSKVDSYTKLQMVFPLIKQEV